MRWINHSATAFCVTMVVTANPILSVIAATTSAMPDQIEIFLPLSRHRRISHDILLWVPLMLILTALTFIPFSSNPPVPMFMGMIRVFLAGLALGVVMHLLMDGLSKSGIPILGKYRFAAGCYKTFTMSEYVLSLGICLPCLAISSLLRG